MLIGKYECCEKCCCKRKRIFVEVETVGMVSAHELGADDEVVGLSAMCLYTFGKYGEVFACAERYAFVYGGEDAEVTSDIIGALCEYIMADAVSTRLASSVMARLIAVVSPRTSAVSVA